MTARLVVATDFSPPSEVATEQAANLALHLGANLALAHAAKPVDADVSAPDDASFSEELHTIVREAETAERAALDERVAELRGRGIDATAVALAGYPDTVIPDAASRMDAKLIVCGTHGRTGLKRLFLGSVAERILRAAGRSVLIARNTAGAGGFHKMLVPVDFSDLSLAAVDMALELAAPTATVELYHAWQLPPQASVRAQQAVLEPLLRKMEAEVERRGAELLARYQGAAQNVTVRTERRSATGGIESRLDAESFEVVVMGSHGRRGLNRFFIGSVAESTVRNANCSVIVVQTPEP